MCKLGPQVKITERQYNHSSVQGVMGYEIISEIDGSKNIRRGAMDKKVDTALR